MPRKFYNPVTSLLLADKDKWQGMRLTGQVRRAEGLKTPLGVNSTYKVRGPGILGFKVLMVCFSLLIDPQGASTHLKYLVNFKPSCPMLQRSRSRGRKVIRLTCKSVLWYLSRRNAKPSALSSKFALYAKTKWFGGVKSRTNARQLTVRSLMQQNRKRRTRGRKNGKSTCVLLGKKPNERQKGEAVEAQNDKGGSENNVIDIVCLL